MDRRRNRNSCEYSSSPPGINSPDPSQRKDSPKECESDHLVAATHTPPLIVTAQIVTDPTVSDEPVVEAVRAARVEKCSKEKGGRRGKKWREDPDNANACEDRSTADQQQPGRSGHNTIGREKTMERPNGASRSSARTSSGQAPWRCRHRKRDPPCGSAPAFSPGSASAPSVASQRCS